MTVKQSPVNAMLAAGPDKYSNQYSVYISRKKRGTTEEEEFNTSWLFSPQNAFESEKSSNKSRLDGIIQNSENCLDLDVRAVNVEIPLPKSQTSQFSFFNTSIELTNTKLAFQNKSSLTLEMDNKLFYLDAIQELAGHKNYVRTDADKEDYKNGKNLFINTSNEYVLNLYVISNVLGTANYIHNAEKNLTFKFEDIKFLGNESEIKFDKSANIIECTFPFIFFDLKTTVEY